MLAKMCRTPSARLQLQDENPHNLKLAPWCPAGFVAGGRLIKFMVSSGLGWRRREGLAGDFLLPERVHRDYVRIDHHPHV